jgi:predicted dehydrogenase
MAGRPPVRIGLIGAGSIARAHAIAYASARTYCGRSAISSSPSPAGRR